MTSMIVTIQNWDASVLRWMHLHVQTEALDQIMMYITYMGNMGIIWVVLAVALFLIAKKTYLALQVSISLGLSFLISNLLLKNVVHRLRPYDVLDWIELLIASLDDYSFPSGHTSAAFAVATVLLLNRARGGYLFLGLAMLMGFSRVYLLVHYPTDVIAGMIIGCLLGFITFEAWKKRSLRT